MNWFDLTILRSLTSFANAWPAFDRFTNSLVSYLIATLFTDLRQAGLWLYGYIAG